MTDLQTHPAPSRNDVGDADNRDKLLVSGGVVGAVLASSCCILPLVLILSGVSGAWIGQLKVLEPYSGYISAITLIILGFAFRQVYFARPKPCEDGTQCSNPQSTKAVKIILWLATTIVVATLTLDWWAPLFY